MKRLLLLFAFLGVACAQYIPPGGSASSSAQIVALFTGCSGTLYLGADGACHAASGSGTVTSASVVTANGVSATVANATTTPAFTFTLGAITPTTIVASGAVTAPSFASGTSPPAVTPGTGGVPYACTEGTVPSVGAAAGVDIAYCDSTQHGVLQSRNNGAYLPIPQGPASTTSAHVACWNSTNGGLLSDCTAAPSGFTLVAPVLGTPASGVMTNMTGLALAGTPLTTRGDILVANSTPALARLAIGAANTVLHGSSTDPSYSAIVNGDIANSTIDLTAKVTGLLPAANIASNVRVRGLGASFQNGGSALVAGATAYFTIPYACTISAWNVSVDAGTATIDIWKIGTGTAIPTVSNTITASATPAISTGTSVHSTTLTAWTTSVTANDIFGINLKTVATATQANLVVECDQ